MSAVFSIALSYWGPRDYPDEQITRNFFKIFDCARMCLAQKLFAYYLIRETHYYIEAECFDKLLERVNATAAILILSPMVSPPKASHSHTALRVD